MRRSFIGEMEAIELKWYGPHKFTDVSPISNDYGIYIHSIFTNRERIWYVGEGYLHNCQARHLKNLSTKKNSTINYSNIRTKDYFDYCTRDRLLKYPEINVEGNRWSNKFGEDSFEYNLNELKANTNIYIATVQNKFYSEFTSILKKCLMLSIEATIQFYLIKEFYLDVYSNYNFKVGLCNNNRKFVDNSIEISNDFENLTGIHKKFMNDHLNRQNNGYLSLCDFSLEQIEIVKYKTVIKTWDTVIEEVNKLSNYKVIGKNCFVS